MKQIILDRYKNVEFRFHSYFRFKFIFTGKFNENSVQIEYGEGASEIEHLEVESNRSYSIAYLLEDSGFSITEYDSDPGKEVVFDYKN